MTLVEMVIALSLLSLLTLSAIIVVVPVGRQARLGREIDVATTAVRTLLQKVQLMDFDEISPAYQLSAVSPITNLPGGNVDVTSTTISADTIEIKFTLSWNSPDIGTFSKTFTTLRTR